MNLSMKIKIPISLCLIPIVGYYTMMGIIYFNT
jgi:hypothetical protein